LHQSHRQQGYWNGSGAERQNREGETQLQRELPRTHAIKGGPAVTKEEKEEEERQAARERVYAAFGGESHIEYGALVGVDGGTQGGTVVSGGVVSTNSTSL
jgi:acetyl-CoA carboxylase carboxyltransferase component